MVMIIRGKPRKTVGIINGVIGQMGARDRDGDDGKAKAAEAVLQLYRVLCCDCLRSVVYLGGAVLSSSISSSSLLQSVVTQIKKKVERM
jgi:hypothetical protein